MNDDAKKLSNLDNLCIAALTVLFIMVCVGLTYRLGEWVGGSSGSGWMLVVGVIVGGRLERIGRRNKAE